MIRNQNHFPWRTIQKIKPLKHQTFKRLAEFKNSIQENNSLDYFNSWSSSRLRWKMLSKCEVLQITFGVQPSPSCALLDKHPPSSSLSLNFIMYFSDICTQTFCDDSGFCLKMKPPRKGGCRAELLKPTDPFKGVCRPTNTTSPPRTNKKPYYWVSPWIY